MRRRERATPIGILIAVIAAVAACGGDSVTTTTRAQPLTATSATSAPSAPAGTTTPKPGVEASQGAPWPRFGGDDAVTLRRDDPKIGVDTVAALQVAWQIEDLGGVTGTPAIVDGVVYFGDWNGVLHAVTLDTGAQIWERRLTPNTPPYPGTLTTGVSLTASPLVTDSLVYIPDMAGALHAVARDSGSVVWSTTLDEEAAMPVVWSSPIEADGRIVIGTGAVPPFEGFRGSVVAVDASTGGQKWRTFVGGPDDGTGTAITVWSSAAVDRERGLAFIGTGNTNLGDPAQSPLANAVLAIDYETGDIEWVYRFVEEVVDTDLDVGAAPNLLTVDERDVVGVGSKSGDYALLDRTTGEQIWRTDLTAGSRGGGVEAPAAVGDSVIYVHSYDYTTVPTRSLTFALNARDGTVIWSRDLGRPIFSAPAPLLVDGVLFQGRDRVLYAMDAATGDLLWERELPAIIGGGLSLSAGYLIVGYGSGLPIRPLDVGGVVAFTVGN